jgi:hypothetical protein
VATITGQRARSILPTPDTPGCVTGLSRTAAEAAWRAVVPAVAGTPHVRISRDGGRTYPARRARPLPADAPDQPCTVAVYDPASATGRMLALDLDPARGDVEDQAAELVQLLECLGARYVADVSPSGGRHVYILFADQLPWLELRDVARALSQRLPVVDPAPMSSLGGQISPPGAGGGPATEPERTLSRFGEGQARCPGWVAGSLACDLVLADALFAIWRPAGTAAGRCFGSAPWRSRPFVTIRLAFQAIKPSRNEASTLTKSARREGTT